MDTISRSGKRLIRTLFELTKICFFLKIKEKGLQKRKYVVLILYFLQKGTPGKRQDEYGISRINDHMRQLRCQRCPDVRGRVGIMNLS